MLKFKTIVFLSLIFLSTADAQRRVLPPSKIGKLLPSKVKGYYLNQDAKNSLINVGTLRYSLTERSFAKGPKSIKILLFDYVEAPIMYNQAIRRWREIKYVENDSIIYCPYSHPDSSAWESYSSVDKHAQVVMGINSRFFLTASGEKIGLDELRRILGLIPFEKFPN